MMSMIQHPHWGAGPNLLPLLSLFFGIVNIYLLIILIPTGSNGGTVNLGIESKHLLFNQNSKGTSLSVSLSDEVVNNRVNITCIQLQSGQGYSHVTFRSQILPIGASAGYVNFSIVSPGRSVSVRCIGESLNGGIQYLKTNSSGTVITLTVNRGPTASICQDVVLVKAYTNTLQYVTVKLSEAVQNNPVFVECFIWKSSTGLSKLQVQFDRATIPVLQSQVQVAFKITQSGSAVSVSCRAISEQCAPPLPASASAVLTTTTVASSPVLVIQVNDTRSPLMASNTSSQSTAVGYNLTVFSSSLTASPVFTSTNKAGITSSNSLRVELSSTPGIPSQIIQQNCQYLYESSEGPPVTFAVEQPKINAYPPSADFQSLEKHVSFIALDKPLEESENVELNCAIKAINMREFDDKICGSGLPVSGANQISINGTVLKLLENKITFKRNEYYKNITVLIKEIANVTFNQLFHTYCCVRSSSTRYRGESVAVFLWIEMKGSKTFSWTAVPTLTQRKITDVMSLDFSCPCNLLDGMCDVNCCCDKECSALEQQAFICRVGSFGGRPTKTFEFDCQATWPESTDWQPVLCVVTNNSPFIGYLFKYTSPAFAKSESEFNQLSKGRPKYTFEEKEARSRKSSNKKGYEYGMPIKTNIGTLSLPRNMFGGATCMFSPIHYLQDASTSCLYEAARNTCNEETLNSLNYVMPQGLIFPSCPTIPSVLDENTGTSFAPTSVEYYCLKNSTDYVILNIIQKEDNKIVGESLFAPLSEDRNLTERCSFDDSKTRPPSPIFNDATNTCNNVVLDVSYKFAWSALRIYSVVAKITLGSFPVRSIKQTESTYSFPVTRIITPTISTSSIIPIESPVRYSVISNGIVSSLIEPSSRTANIPTVLLSSRTFSIQSSIPAPVRQPFTVVTMSSTVVKKNITVVPTVVQKYTVTFSYLSIQQQSLSLNGSFLVSTAVSSSSNQTISIRSGNPGYISGRPLTNQTFIRSGNPGYILGRPVMTQTLNEILLNTSSTNGLTVWRPTSTGLCTTAKRFPVPFGKDSMSGCILYLGVDALSNCSKLRDVVKKNQDELIKAVRVGRRGNASPLILSDWLSIIRTEPNMTTNASPTEGTCDKIPAHVKIEVLVAEAGKSKGQSQMEISGIRLSYDLKTWKLDCLNGKYYNCFNTTTAYSKLQDPLYKTFVVTSSVVFVKIPAVEPPKTKRSAKTIIVCWSSCLRELLYPLRSAYDASLDFDLAAKLTQSSTAMAVTLIFLVFSGVYVARPWR